MQEAIGKPGRVCSLLLVLGQGGQWLCFPSNDLSHKHQLTASIPGTALTSPGFHPLTQCNALGTAVICEASSKIPGGRHCFPASYLL